MNTLQKYKEILRIKNEDNYYKKFVKEYESYDNGYKTKTKFEFDNKIFHNLCYVNQVKKEMVEILIAYISREKGMIDVLKYINDNEKYSLSIKLILLKTVQNNKNLEVLQMVEKINKNYNLRDMFLDAFWEEHIQEHVKYTYRTFPFNDLTSEEIKILKGLRKVL